MQIFFLPPWFLAHLIWRTLSLHCHSQAHIIMTELSLLVIGQILEKRALKRYNSAVCSAVCVQFLVCVCARFALHIVPPCRAQCAKATNVLCREAPNTGHYDQNYQCYDPILRIISFSLSNWNYVLRESQTLCTCGV